MGMAPLPLKIFSGAGASGDTTSAARQMASSEADSARATGAAALAFSSTATAASRTLNRRRLGRSRTRSAAASVAATDMCAGAASPLRPAAPYIRWCRTLESPSCIDIQEEAGINLASSVLLPRALWPRSWLLDRPEVLPPCAA